jgi:histone deacetylase 1/2
LEEDNGYGGVEDEEKVSADVSPNQEVQEPRRSNRSNAGVKQRDENFQYSFNQFTVREGIGKYGQKAKDAVIAEFRQLFKDKDAVMPVKRSDLSYAAQLRKVIRSSMFLKEKFDAFGNFEKLKARLVGDGRMQDKKLYDDLKSPTAMIDHIIMCLVNASYKKWKIGKVDISGAYLNAMIDDKEEVYMELSKQITEVLVEGFPELKPYVTDDGKLLVKIMKALYGLVQSAALWFDALSSFLKSIGFVPNCVDECILNLKTNEREICIALYVDDILILLHMNWISFG